MLTKVVALDHASREVVANAMPQQVRVQVITSEGHCFPPKEVRTRLSASPHPVD